MSRSLPETVNNQVPFEKVIINNIFSEELIKKIILFVFGIEIFEDDRKS